MFLWGLLKVGFLGVLGGDSWWILNFLDFNGGGYLGTGIGGCGGEGGGLEDGGGWLIGKFVKRWLLLASVTSVVILRYRNFCFIYIYVLQGDYHVQRTGTGNSYIIN